MEFQDFPKVIQYMREVPPIYPSNTLRDIAKHMVKYKTPIVAVVEDNHTMLGAVDITMLIKPFIPDFLDFINDFSFLSNFGALEHKIFSGEMSQLFLAMDIMQKDYPHVEEDESVVKALFCIYKSDITGLIVEKQQVYKGIISRFDLLKFLYDTDN